MDKKFKIHSNHSLAGDQPQAVDSLVQGIKRGDDAQVLKGITGSGKTFTIANVIERVQKPTLIIAHRLSTIQNADCIAVVGDKEILEMGTHQQLMEKGGAYASLYQL